MKNVSSLLAFLPVADLISRFRSGACSPVDVLTEQLARISAYDPQLNAFRQLDREGALKAASESAARWKSGKQLGGFDGISFTVKDNFMVKGFPYRRGSVITPKDPVDETSPIVARLLEAGGVMVGLTTMPEFGAGATTNSPLTGITRNPWNPAMHSGGSTGGGAVSVSAGFCTVALGSDAGGSLRIPASLCGVIGFKPTGGALPVYPPNFVGSVSSPGPVTRNIDDVFAVLQLASAPDVRDPFSNPVRFERLDPARMKEIKIAWSIGMGYAPHVDQQVAQLVEAAINRFTQTGATISNANPATGSPLDAFATLCRANYRYTLRDIGDAKAHLAPALKAMLEDSGEVSIAQYLKTQDDIQSLAQKLHKFHDDYDLLVLPTVAHPAFPAERGSPAAFDKFENSRAWSPFTSLFNLTQQPAISIPVGLTAEGLPVGMQIVGARGADSLVLAAAAAYLKLVPSLGEPPLK